jgi:Acetyltransferases, including N-acetylases of ribosomal proteins
VALENINYVSRHAMFSIFIANQAYHNKGIGSASTKLIIEFAFKKLNLNKVYLQTSDRFVSAIKMYEKLGFQKEGIMRQHYYSNGKYEDKIIFSILKEDFNKTKSTDGEYMDGESNS